MSDFASSIRSDLIPAVTAMQLQNQLEDFVKAPEIKLLKFRRRKVALILPIAAYDQLELLIEILRKTHEIRDFLIEYQKGRQVFETSPEFDNALKRAGIYIERLRKEWLLKQKELMES